VQSAHKTFFPSAEGVKPATTSINGLFSLQFRLASPSGAIFSLAVGGILIKLLTRSRVAQSDNGNFRRSGNDPNRAVATATTI
jgi:hypothetical protein